MRHGARFALLIVLLGLVAAGVAAHVAQPAIAAGMRHAVFDQYQRWLPRSAAADAPVRVVDIDEDSLARFGQWPWPRDRLAALHDRLTAAGAVAVGFDILFAEADRSSPPVLARELTLPSALRDAMAALPDHDAAFARSLAAGPSVLGFAVERGAGAAPPDWPFRTVVLNGAEPPASGAYFATIAPWPTLAAAAAGLGAISFAPDADGVVRRVPLVMALDSGWVPALALELLRVAQGERNLVIEGAAGLSGLTQVGTGAVRVPVTAAGELWLHYAPAPEVPFLPAWQVLAGEVADTGLAGSVVIVGSSAKGLLDLRFSPLGGALPGVEVHAQAVRQMLTGAVLVRPWWAEAAELAVLLVASALLALLAWRVGVVPAVATAVVVLGGVAGVAWWAFADHRLLLDPALPGLTAAAVFAVTSVARHRRDEGHQRWLRHAFARYVSPNLVDYLMHHPDALRLGGERRTCSFVFTDLAGYTHLIEQLDPAAAVGLLNEYLDGMVAIAFRHQGTLDRIVGDAVAVLFSAPLAQPDHAARALACALEMQRFTDDFAATSKRRGVALGHTRIGVHCGEVLVGNFGGSTMFDYRALGDPVNTAARLESANKWIGTRICMSEAVRAASPDVPARAVGRLLLQGKTVPLMVFEPLADTAVDADYDAAYALLVAGADEAVAAFERLAAARPADTLVAFQLARARAGGRGDLIVLDAK